MTFADWSQIHTHILQFEEEGLVTRTFRRLDPERQQVILTAIPAEAIKKGPAAAKPGEIVAAPPAGSPARR